LRRFDCEQRIAAEEKALETTAQISEGRKAKLAFDAFELSELFLQQAKQVHKQHPMAAAKLGKTAIEIAALICGAATALNANHNIMKSALSLFIEPRLTLRSP
jgi:hypothetical protein